MRTYSKPNMAALHGKVGKMIVDYIRNQTVATDSDIKSRADVCMERIKQKRKTKNVVHH